jgi:Tfp pilus assembly protein PilO
MNKRVKLLLMAAGLVVVAALVWFFLLSPIRGDIAALDTQIEEEQSQLLAARTKLAQAEATRDEGKRNQARLLELAKLMPTEAEIPSLLLQIQDLADEAGIEFIAISPGDSKLSDDKSYRTLSLDLEFEGTYFSVTDFVYRAERMASGPGRLLSIKELGLEIKETTGAETVAGASPNLGVNMTMEAYLLGAGDLVETLTAAPAATTPTTEAGGNKEQ